MVLQNLDGLCNRNGVCACIELFGHLVNNIPVIRPPKQVLENALDPDIACLKYRSAATRDEVEKNVRVFLLYPGSEFIGLVH